MNDCFWCFIEGVCDGCNCHNCKDYLSVNSEEGSKIFEKYQADVDEALIPVTEKWKQLKDKNNEYKTETSIH